MGLPHVEAHLFCLWGQSSSPRQGDDSFALLALVSKLSDLYNPIYDVEALKKKRKA